MKKLFGMLVISALVTSAFAQGTVTFQNNTAGWIYQWTSPANNTLEKLGTATSANPGSVELLSAPAGTALVNPLVSYLGGLPANGAIVNYATVANFLTANPGWSAVATTTPTPVAGLINGGAVALTGVAAGANAEYFLIGWTGSFATFDAALAANTGSGMFGESALLTTATGGAGTPPSTPVNLNGSFTGLTMAPIIPEPTSFALAGLGLAALLVFRRRN